MNSKQFFLCSLCIIIVLAGTAFGVPANMKVCTFTQPDGTTFQAALCGDEFFSYHQTPEGRIIQQDKATGEWFYAEPKADGSLRKTAIRVGSDVSTSQLNREKTQWLNAAKSKVDRNILKVRGDFGRVNRVPAKGSIKGVLLMANFSDTLTQYSQSNFNNLMNENGYDYDGALGSVKDYYLEASYGQLSMQTDVYGWFKLSQSRAYYGRNGADDYDENPEQMVIDAIKAADATVNFADYDSDGDGWVDVFGVVHQGQGEEQTGASSDCIFSHRGSLGSPMTVDGVSIRDYYTVPERYYQSLTTIGVFCHEIGHVFRLVDLYDYDDSSVGLGDWSIMAYGSWLGPDRNGAKPCHFDPWSKYMLKWIDPDVIYAPQNNNSLPAFDTHPNVLLIPVDSYQDGEYFLVANRYARATASAATGFEEYLPGSGAMILHVDDYMPHNDDEIRKKVDVEEADGHGSLDMSLPESNYNVGDRGDLYPNGSSAFDSSTNPNSNDNDGYVTGIEVYNFKGAGTAAMTCDVAPSADIVGFTIFYDSLGNDYNFALGFDTEGDDYSCVRFTADEGGILERVKTSFVYGGTTDYTINIYSGWSGYVPTDLLNTQSGSHTGTGFEEIYLSEPQRFDEGDEFVIEIRYNTHGGYFWPLPIANDGDCSRRTYVRSSSEFGYYQLTPAGGYPYDALIRAGMRPLPAKMQIGGRVMDSQYQEVE